MRDFFKLTFVIVLVLLQVSCNKNSRPNYQYFPNMYESVGYEAYVESDAFPNGQEAQLPPEGTVSRGNLPYNYSNTQGGYQLAKDSLRSPLRYTEANQEAGKKLYGIYCAICHGDKGNGKGTLAQREKILGIPSYADAGRAITAGSIYHVMYYGINTMGSYASQTTTKERWQIAQYVLALKSKLQGSKPRLDVLSGQAMATSVTTDDMMQVQPSSETLDDHGLIESTAGVGAALDTIIKKVSKIPSTSKVKGAPAFKKFIKDVKERAIKAADSKVDDAVKPSEGH